ncbi:hypothetical protein MITS9509_01347 [Synechococcus sp. MIT S9509]|uniref:hypothetical protein n=1 Tax=Synechococcus sp. MIT S9509 TaxID=1801630 RepID=UPI0007BB080F|nr:hypothetical protein [Synechococcus sp. MIT S9509]KZR92360.1 hypothetical protein MITS9509_01347 [Synechococcus sp. MIT S9509]
MGGQGNCTKKGTAGIPLRASGQPTDSNRAMRREVEREDKRKRRDRFLSSTAKNGFGNT